MDLPRTDYHLCADNPVERMFWGKLPLERATSYFFYHKGSDFRRILHQLKYGGRKDLGETMGRFMAAELTVSEVTALMIKEVRGSAFQRKFSPEHTLDRKSVV